MLERYRNIMSTPAEPAQANLEKQATTLNVETPRRAVTS
jgi:hypothetical protein